ncbi:hypothetical protein M8J75_012509 [Diaphorina citri]|nr:hypothetical protein M8J75_012509 [Diaphorina citri]
MCKGDDILRSVSPILTNSTCQLRGVPRVSKNSLTLSMIDWHKVVRFTILILRPNSSSNSSSRHLIHHNYVT